MGTQKNIAILGLGSMGYGIAASVLRAGHEAYGFDISPAPVERFVREGGNAGDVAEVGPAIDIAVVVVLNAAQTESVLFGEAGVVQWMFENRRPHVVAGDYTPHSAVNIWLKDLGIILDVAKEVRFSAPLTATALQQFVAASGSGLGGEDDAAVAKVYARNAGLSLPRLGSRTAGGDN